MQRQLRQAEREIKAQAEHAARRAYLAWFAGLLLLLGAGFGLTALAFALAPTLGWPGATGIAAAIAVIAGAIGLVKASDDPLSTKQSDPTHTA